MQEYYRSNVEIAKEFGLAESTVRKWIKRALAGDMNLQLIEVKDKQKILKNEHNRLLLEDLSEKARSIRTTDQLEVIEASEELEDYFSKRQILALINSIEVLQEIPIKYIYIGKGAGFWDKMYNKSVTTATSSYQSHSSDIMILETLYTFIIKHFRKFPKINIVDIGQGNSEPVIPLLKKLQAENKLNSYITIDISREMQEIAKEHIERSGLKINHQMINLDFESQSLQDSLFEVKNDDNEAQVIPNLLLMLDGTLANSNSQTKILENIREGMCPEDFLLIGDSLDNPRTRARFPAFDIEEGSNLFMHIPYLLGLENDLFDRKLIYNPEKDMRECNLVLKKNIDLYFPSHNRTIKLYKQDKINIWKHKKDTFEFISHKAKQAGLQLHMICKYPEESEVIYMLGII